MRALFCVHDFQAKNITLIYLVYGASWGVLTMTDNESTAGWFIKLFMGWSTHVNLKSCGNKILCFVASSSRNHYCTTAGWNCLKLNRMRFVRQLQNTILAFLKFKFDFEWLFQNFAKASREHVFLQRLLPSRRSGNITF